MKTLKIIIIIIIKDLIRQKTLWIRGWMMLDCKKKNKNKNNNISTIMSYQIFY